jgi:hypothetical protein
MRPGSHWCFLLGAEILIVVSGHDISWTSRKVSNRPFYRPFDCSNGRRYQCYLDRRVQSSQFSVNSAKLIATDPGRFSYWLKLSLAMSGVLASLTTFNGFYFEEYIFC